MPSRLFSRACTCLHCRRSVRQCSPSCAWAAAAGMVMTGCDAAGLGLGIFKNRGRRAAEHCAHPEDVRQHVRLHAVLERVGGHAHKRAHHRARARAQQVRHRLPPTRVLLCHGESSNAFLAAAVLRFCADNRGFLEPNRVQGAERAGPPAAVHLRST